MIYNRAFGFNLPTNPNRLRSLSVFVIGNNDDDKKYIRTSNCIAAAPETADFVLARGTFGFLTDLDDATDGGVISYKRAEDLMLAVEPWLDRCIVRGIPMLVSNPDFYRPGSGSPMPGLIGKMYSEKGGVVQYIGKPHRVVYDACFKVLSENDKIKVDKMRTCGVGDSLDHDILGARQAGIDSVWTANGVHCTEMGCTEESSELASTNVLNEMYRKYGVSPTHTVPKFRW